MSAVTAEQIFRFNVFVSAVRVAQDASHAIRTDSRGCQFDPSLDRHSGRPQVIDQHGLCLRL
jgi:hypothetical protein